MKKSVLFICWAIALGSLTGCGKNGQSPTQGKKTGTLLGAPSYFFSNTEWVGTNHTLSQEYDKPCCIRFKGDTAVTVFSLFQFKINASYVLADSINGKITKVDSLPDGRITVALSFSLTGDQQMWYISNKKTIAGSSLATNNSFNSFNVGVQIAPAAVTSIINSTWSGKVVANPGFSPTLYYPDLSTILFGTQYEEFSRNGLIITYTPTTTIQQIQWAFTQRRSMVYFAGYDETYDKLYPYFGVLAPDGLTMWVDARPVDQSINGYGTPRLPNYIYTNEPFGPNGVTPLITKQ